MHTYLGKTVFNDICWGGVQLLLLSTVAIKVRNNTSIAVFVSYLPADGVEQQAVPYTAWLKKRLSN